MQRRIHSKNSASLNTAPRASFSLVTGRASKASVSTDWRRQECQGSKSVIERNPKNLDYMARKIDADRSSRSGSSESK